MPAASTSHRIRGRANRKVPPLLTAPTPTEATTGASAAILEATIEATTGKATGGLTGGRTINLLLVGRL